MDDDHHHRSLRRRVRLLLTVFLVGLVLSGLTAFPLEWELEVLTRWMGVGEAARPEDYTGLRFWLVTVRNGLRESYAAQAFLAYGTDWLAFAHLVIAVFFIGPLRDPVRNQWVIHAGMAACLLVVPLALICGPIRGIPLYWRLIDCSFGVGGFIPLWLAARYVRRLAAIS